MNNDIIFYPEVQQVWDLEMEILDVVDRLCRKNGLRYSIAYGTMLGAVRHGGFIPWDDDIDIIMPFPDYAKFISVWQHEKPNGFVIQNKLTNWDFTQNFTKVRKDKTTFIQDEIEKTKSYHKGVFIDVFPGYRIPPGKISRKLQLLASAVNLLFSRDFSSGSGGFSEIVERVLLRFPTKIKKLIYIKTLNMFSKYCDNKDYNYFFPNTIGQAHKIYPSNMFDNLVDIDFVNRKYMCVADTDSILTIDYGDYMELPPKEERGLKHHPIIIDAEHNYEDLYK